MLEATLTSKCATGSMNGAPQPAEVVELDKPAYRPDLLTHKYRPDSVDKIKCHQEQAQRLKQWILEFTNASRNIHNRSHELNHDDEDYDDDLSLASDDSNAAQETARKCVLLTGPPGVGKTSLVYTVAKELNMHVVESHSSERRDFKMFSTLKLANQKGKINPIAKLFQAAQNKQQPPKVKNKSKRKRRKLDELQQSLVSNNGEPQKSNQCLSLSGDSSLVLFDDIDVVFKDDGPFLKSLAEFVRESKRPVVLTATQSIDYIKTILVHFEHIHLGTPMIEQCSQVLKDVCRKEHLYQLAKIANCRSMARKMNCDIRQCLNRIHFYGEQAAHSDDLDATKCVPDITRLSEFLTNQGGEVASETDDTTRDSNMTECCNQLDESDQSKDLLNTYDSHSIVDLMDSAFHFYDRKTLLARWLNGTPSTRNEEHSCDHDLGEQIKKSIVELTENLLASETISQEDIFTQMHQKKQREPKCEELDRTRLELEAIMSSQLRDRMEPPEWEFYADIVNSHLQLAKRSVTRSHTNWRKETKNRSHMMQDCELGGRSCLACSRANCLE